MQAFRLVSKIYDRIRNGEVHPPKTQGHLNSTIAATIQGNLTVYIELFKEIEIDLNDLLMKFFLLERLHYCRNTP